MTSNDDYDILAGTGIRNAALNEHLFGGEVKEEGWTGELVMSNPNMPGVVYPDPDAETELLQAIGRVVDKGFSRAMGQNVAGGAIQTPPHFVGDAETQAVMTPIEKNYRLIHCANGGWIITQELYGPPLGAFTDFEDAVEWMREHIT